METRNGIHVIDCSNIRKPLREIQDTEAFKTFAEKFGNALKLNGIVYLINTEVEDDTISNFQQKLAEFYSLPLDAKKMYSPDKFDLSAYGSWGWSGPTQELLQRNHTLETFDFTSNPRLNDDALYPKEIGGFKDAVLAFRNNARNMSTKLLRCLAESLQLEDKDFFIQQHRAFEENYAKSKCSVRTLYYPKEPQIRENATKYRMVEHQDFGTLSHIHQASEGGGLQAKLHTGEWVDVEYIPNSFVVFAGRSLEMWSGGNIPAVLHRVAWTEQSKTESRISFGCFLGPDRDVCCLSQVKENPNWTPMYETMKAGEIYDEYYKREVRLYKDDDKTIPASASAPTTPITSGKAKNQRDSRNRRNGGG